MTAPGRSRPRQPPAAIFAAHRAAPYAALAAAAADRLPPDLTGVLVALHVVRAASFQGRAVDPWLASAEQFRADLQRLAGDVEIAAGAGLVQFTEPLRMADLFPGLLLAARRYPGRPLRLVELGSCAGLLLVPEAYRIDYPQGSWAPPAARVRLTSDLDVPPGLLATPFVIADRLGLDLSPVAPGASQAFDHLRSFAWAGDPNREPRLAAALAAVAQDPPKVARADVTEALPEVLSERVERDAVTVVIESGLSTYLSGRQTLHLGRALDSAARRGPVVLVARAAHQSRPDDLPNIIAIIDLSQRWRCSYAATDLISERTRWTSPRTLAEVLS